MKALLATLILISFKLMAVAQNIVQVEYFLDTDAGVAKNNVVTISPSPDGNFPLLVNISGANAGYHQLYIRTKDDNGLWSHTSRKIIEVVPVQTQNNVTMGEYFIDQEPGVGSGLPIAVSPQDSILSKSFAATVSELSPGVHKIYVRVKDSYGKWSHTSKSTFERILLESDNKIATGEYFFDKDPGFGHAAAIPVSVQDSIVNQSFVAVVLGLSPGPHILYARFPDSYGKWSQTMRRTIEVLKSSDSNYVATLEYFFKKDPYFGNAIPIQLAAKQDGAFSFMIPVNNLPSGIDTLFLRVKDSSTANWSLTNWKVVPYAVPLPLTLLNFSAIKQGQTVLLHWQTENETNTAYFSLERSIDGRNFTSIAKVNAKNNYISLSDYGYKDAIDEIKFNKLFYRLQQVDNNGNFTYSNIVNVLGESGDVQFSILPNPASDYIIVIPASGINAKGAVIQITDIAGRTLIRQRFTNVGIQKISVSSFAKGIYTISLLTPGNVQTQKIAIVK